MKAIQYGLLSIVILLFAVAQAKAGSATLPNTFTANTKAIVAQINANFTPPSCMTAVSAAATIVPHHE